LGKGELNKKPDGRLFFSKSIGKTGAGDIHLHLVVKGDRNNLISLRLRDYLLKHPEDVRYYNKKKRELASLTNNDRGEYVVRKTDVMNTLMKKVNQAS